MQLFAGELTNQNREYYKVNDNMRHARTQKLQMSGLAVHSYTVIPFSKMRLAKM